MNHHKLTIEEVARIAEGLGVIGLKNLSERLTAIGAKHGERTLGQVEAVLNMIDSASLDSLLAGKATIEIKEAFRTLVDKNGRMIPPVGMKSAVCDPNNDFKLVQPEVNYFQRLRRLVDILPEISFPGWTTKKFRESTLALVEEISQNHILANLLNGIWLPVLYPRFSLSDHGRALRDSYLPAVSNSYRNQFSDRSFINSRENNLEGKVYVCDKSHKRFLSKMEKESFVGIQFFPFQGFSISASRECMEYLPESFALSGPIDLALAITMYPDVLVHYYKTPAFDCSAVFWESPSSTLGFWTLRADTLEFGRTDDLGKAREDHSSGLIYLGSGFEV